MVLPKQERHKKKIQNYYCNKILRLMEAIYANTLKLKFTGPSQCNFLKRNRLFEQKEAPKDFFFVWEIVYFLTATKFIIDPSQFSNSPSSLPSSSYACRSISFSSSNRNQITIAHSHRHLSISYFLCSPLPPHFIFTY